jgi:hypothetical protein
VGGDKQKQAGSRALPTGRANGRGRFCRVEERRAKHKKWKKEKRIYRDDGNPNVDERVPECQKQKRKKKAREDQGAAREVRVPITFGSEIALRGHPLLSMR